MISTYFYMNNEEGCYLYIFNYKLIPFYSSTTTRYLLNKSMHFFFNLFQSAIDKNLNNESN